MGNKLGDGMQQNITRKDKFRMTKNIETTPVDPTYRHHPKTVTPHGIFRPNNSRLKWYDIARSDQSIDASLRDVARKFLDDQMLLTGVPNNNELGFVLLHRCGGGFYFLMLCTWRDANEIWKTVYYFDAEKMEGFALFPQDEPHKGTFCVWEMSVVTHETHAWVQYLMSERGQKDEDVYLRSMAGESTG